MDEATAPTGGIDVDDRTDLPGPAMIDDTPETTDEFDAELDTTDEETADPTGGETPSVLDDLRRAYQESGEERRTILPILPGRFGGNLAARIRPIPWTDQRKKARRIARQGATEESELDFAAATIAQATEEILVRNLDTGELEPMADTVDEWNGVPVRFDDRLARVLGIDNPPRASRSICRLVFKNPAALNDFYVEVNNFLTESSPGDDEDEDEERPT